MTFKTLFFSFTLLAAVNAEAAYKNLCDDMIASGKWTDEQIKKCLTSTKPGMGESDSYKEKAEAKKQADANEAQKKKWQEQGEKNKSVQDEIEKSNLEIKVFTSADLDEVSFGKPIFAQIIEYSPGKKPEVSRLTSGDALCKYLGYEKAAKSIISNNEIKPLQAYQNGLIIDTNIFGVAKKEPELFSNKEINYVVKKYVEVTCTKVKSKDLAVAEVTEVLAYINDPVEGINASKNNKNKKVNDGPRKPAGSEFGFKEPDWKKDDVAPESGGAQAK